MSYLEFTVLIYLIISYSGNDLTCSRIDTVKGLTTGGIEILSVNIKRVKLYIIHFVVPAVSVELSEVAYRHSRMQ